MEEFIMKKIDVEFKSGESRVKPLQDCTYMLASCEVDCEPVELYSEIVVKDWCDEHDIDFEDESFDPEEIDDDIYPVLRGEIVKQAAKYGITEDELKFWWD